MKVSEFKKLIREEVRKVLSEVDGDYNPIGLRFELNLLGTTSDGKNFTGPYKLQPDTKVKLSIIEEGDGNTVPSVNFMTIFRNQLIGKNLGRINIAIDIPWGPVDRMGKDLLKQINQVFASDNVKTDRGRLTNVGDAKKLINSVVAQKWPLLNDKAINNPKALKMMYGMGAAIERVAAVQEGFRKGLKEASMNDVPNDPTAPGKKVTDPVFDYKNNKKPKYPITLDVISMKPIEFGVDYKTPLDLVWLDGIDSPENKYGVSGFTLKTNIPANKQKRITKNTGGTSNYLRSRGY